VDTCELTYSRLALSAASSLSLSLSLSSSLACSLTVQGNIGTSLYQSMSHSPCFPSSWLLLHRPYTRLRRNDIICYFVPRDSPLNFSCRSTARHGIPLAFFSQSEILALAVLSRDGLTRSALVEIAHVSLFRCTGDVRDTSRLAVFSVWHYR